MDGVSAKLELKADSSTVTGISKSVATLQADVINLQGRVDVTGSLTVSTGGISAEKNITAKGNLHVKGAVYFDAENIFLAGTKYTHTTITSTTGAVLALGIA